VNEQTSSLAPSQLPVPPIRLLSWSCLSVSNQETGRSAEPLFIEFNIGEIRYSMYSTSHHTSLQYVQYVTISQFATVCTVRHNFTVRYSCTVRHNITVRYSMYSTSQHHSSLQYVQYVTTSQFQLKSHNYNTSYVLPLACPAQLASTCCEGKYYQPTLLKKLSKNVYVQYISLLRSFFFLRLR
jgi:hypothetical protein